MDATTNRNSSISHSDLDQALALAARQVELARQEHLFLQQEHDRPRLRQRLARQREREQRDRDRQRESTRAPASSQRPPEGEDEPRRPRTYDSSRSQQGDHPVFLLNCKGCGSLLSDRGMKAILLLKPHVTLYSTDVVPTNVGPIYPGDMPLEQSLTSSPSSSQRQAGPTLKRTCDCLTQTLGCYGCGAQVGYHIISPCARCTASITDEKRGSNGHRTVLHCAEITARERKYCPGEAGVRCAPTPYPFPRRVNNGLKPAVSFDSTRGESPSITASFDWSRGSPLGRENAFSGRYPHLGNRNVRMAQIEEGHQFALRSRANYRRAQETEGGRADRSHDHDGDNSSDLDFYPEAEVTDVDDYDDDTMEQDKFDVSITGRLRALSAASQARIQSHLRRQAAADASTDGKSGSGSNGPPARLLRRGDIVYWGDLVPGGERCRPFDSDLALQMPIALR